MRTTVDIDANLLAEAKVLAARTSRPLGAIVDDALRALLRRRGEEASRTEFELPTHGSGGVQAGVDPEDKDSLAELLGDNAAP